MEDTSANSISKESQQFVFLGKSELLAAIKPVDIETMPLTSDEATLKLSQAIIDQLQAVFGKHAGSRPG